MSDDVDKQIPTVSEQIAVCIIEQEEALEQVLYHQTERAKAQRKADTFGAIIATLERRGQEQ